MKKLTHQFIVVDDDAQFGFALFLIDHFMSQLKPSKKKKKKTKKSNSVTRIEAKIFQLPTRHHDPQTPAQSLTFVVWKSCVMESVDCKLEFNDTEFCVTFQGWDTSLESKMTPGLMFHLNSG